MSTSLPAIFDTKELNNYMDTEPVELLAVDHSKVFATEQGQSLLGQISSIIAGDARRQEAEIREEEDRLCELPS